LIQQQISPTPVGLQVAEQWVCKKNDMHSKAELSATQQGGVHEDVQGV